MENEKTISLKSKSLFLFSYLWLAGELIIFNIGIEFFLKGIFSFAFPLFLLIFARVYYWLNFSSQTRIQTTFILMLALFQVIVIQLGIQSYSLTITISTSILMILSGLLIISFTRYKVTSKAVFIKFFRTRMYLIDNSRHLKLKHHSRGKLMNFGCLILPIHNSCQGSSTMIYRILFEQRSEILYKGNLRIDGISDARNRFYELNKTFQNV